MGVNPNQGMLLAAVLSHIGKGYAVIVPPPPRETSYKRQMF